MKQFLKNKLIPLIITALFLFLCQTAVAATLDVSTQKGEKGDFVTFNINLDNAAEDLDSLGLDVQYDFALLKYDSYQRGSLTENFRQLSALNIDLGQVRIGGFDTGENVIAGGASGDIVRLTFEVVGQGDCNIKLTNLKDDLKIYSAQSGQFNYGPQDNGDTDTEPQNTDNIAKPDSEATGAAANQSSVNTGSANTPELPYADSENKVVSDSGSLNNAATSLGNNNAPESAGNTPEEPVELPDNAPPPQDAVRTAYPPAPLSDNARRVRRSTSPGNAKTTISKRPESVKTKPRKSVMTQKTKSKPQTSQPTEQIQALINKNAELIKLSHGLIKENLKLISKNNTLILKNSYALQYMEKTKPASHNNVILIIVGILILLILIFILIALLLLLLHLGFFSSRKSLSVQIERR
jgi:hypothetical protein